MRKISEMTRFSALVAATFLFVSSNALAWWNPDWSYRKAITLDTTPTGIATTSDLTDSPVLIRLHTGNFTHFLDLTEGGGDIRFVAGDDKTPLQFHIEKIDVVNEMAFVWVKIPTLKAASGPAPAPAKDADPAAPVDGTNKIYMYFGNAKATKGGPSPATYTPANALVYHFDDVSGIPADRSPSALPAPIFTGAPNPASLIGAGAKFSGTSLLTIADAPVLAMSPTQGWGFETWVKLDAPQTDAYLFDRKNGEQRLTVAIGAAGVKLSYTPSAGSAVATSEVPLTPAAWHHVAMTVQNGQFVLYVDGAQAGTVSSTAEALAGAIAIGGAVDAGHGLVGEIDELRIYAASPGADAIKLAAATEGVDVRGLTYLADESAEQEGAGEGGEQKSSYFGIILNQVFGNKEAIIEQSVIGICGIMALVAFAVMALKQMYLMKCRQSSDKFLKAYESLGVEEKQGLDALIEQEATFGQSPLFKIYRQGINELRRRRGAHDAPMHMNKRALVAIEAALDAVMVREGQRLNAQMVLLTIAISGGPFIGLLGTVVGVMVTFAAIAATGDVNINAIAPGMAAALLATTAGLAVAIPSLFGYNYLGSKVKELSADMHVFADEFLARMNEIYGD